MRCLPGRQATSCGRAGRACAVCAAPTDSCNLGECVASAALVSMSASLNHTCVADDRQTLWCWGDNKVGQAAADPPLVTRPLAVATGGWANVAVGGGEQAHSCAVHYLGSLWCWGDNSRGQLGVSQPLAFLSRVTKVNNDTWTQVAAGGLMTCAIRADGTLWCWGAGDDGRLGVEGDARFPRIVGTNRDWSAVSAGLAHACAVKQDNTLWCWGSNAEGQLGRSDVAAAASSARPGVVDTSYSQVSAGGQHTCGVRTDKSLWCWGRGSEGQLGLGDALSYAVPQKVGGGYVLVSAGGKHTCGIREDGALLCWGSNERGQVGQGAVSAGVSTPTGVATLRAWRNVTAGGQHTCALAADGTLWCWGAGDRAQTGGLSDPEPNPTRIELQ